jgi:hypothetical protein
VQVGLGEQSGDDELDPARVRLPLQVDDQALVPGARPAGGHHARAAAGARHDVQRHVVALARVEEAEHHHRRLAGPRRDGARRRERLDGQRDDDRLACREGPGALGLV